MEASSIGIVVDKSNATRDWFKERKIAIIGADESKWMTIQTKNLTSEQKKIPMFNAHTFPDNCSYNLAFVNRDVWENANKVKEIVPKPSSLNFFKKIFKFIR